MANQPQPVANLATTNTFGYSTKFVIVHQANTTNPSVRTVDANNLVRQIMLSAPTYANNESANNAGLPVGALYKTANGEVRVVV